VIVELGCDRSVSRVEDFRGGEREAISALDLFIE
jgi:hypothetical protein